MRWTTSLVTTCCSLLDRYSSHDHIAQRESTQQKLFSFVSVSCIGFGALVGITSLVGVTSFASNHLQPLDLLFWSHPSLTSYFSLLACAPYLLIPMIDWFIDILVKYRRFMNCIAESNACQVTSMGVILWIVPCVEVSTNTCRNSDRHSGSCRRRGKCNNRKCRSTETLCIRRWSASRGWITSASTDSTRNEKQTRENEKQTEKQNAKMRNRFT